MFIHGTTFGRRLSCGRVCTNLQRVYFATATETKQKYSQLNCIHLMNAHVESTRRREKEKKLTSRQ